MKKPAGTSDINRLIKKGDEDVMSPYTFMAEVKGFTMPILRDTGTSIDVVCRNRITPEMLTGENIWVQQPLDEFPVCLPLAEVELKG
ncbi:hypothetical protein JTE90_020787 [Oedothorax gibbosus]|uniref:Uncharacterized protein n=1 Tax=Oedothorax gibbosus TaxID=931172 RepID=A0AAV6TUV8_9ARAC|nr:hypothetical protein JTE90_020787 [Oedothorax gibbosus]